MIGVMSGKAFELFAHGHSSRWIARIGTQYGNLETIGIIRDGCGILCAGEKAFAELVPRLAIVGRKAFGGVFRASGWAALDPIQTEVLPVSHVPDFSVDGVRCGSVAYGRCFLRQYFWNTLQNAAGRREGTIADQGFSKLVHDSIVWLRQSTGE